MQVRGCTWAGLWLGAVAMEVCAGAYDPRGKVPFVANDSPVALVMDEHQPELLVADAASGRETVWVGSRVEQGRFHVFTGARAYLKAGNQVDANSRTLGNSRALRKEEQPMDVYFGLDSTPWLLAAEAAGVAHSADAQEETQATEDKDVPLQTAAWMLCLTLAGIAVVGRQRRLGETHKS